MTDTIFFDVGNTLRIVIPDKAFSDAAEKELMELVGATEPHDVFFEKLEKRWKKYRSEVKKTLIDAGEMELWSQHLLPDYDPERVCAHAGRLTRLWRDHDGRRVPRDDVKSTIIELDRRGYTLGIIANTITETEIPDWMIADGVAHYFKAVILSSKVRIRKPDPAIYFLACRAIGKEPGGGLRHHDPHRRAGHHQKRAPGDRPAPGLHHHPHLRAAGYLPAAQQRSVNQEVIYGNGKRI